MRRDRSKKSYLFELIQNDRTEDATASSSVSPRLNTDNTSVSLFITSNGKTEDAAASSSSSLSLNVGANCVPVSPSTAKEDQGPFSEAKLTPNDWTNTKKE